MADRNKQVSAANDADKGAVCDWYAPMIGGYGTPPSCAYIPAAADKPTCIGTFPSLRRDDRTVRRLPDGPRRPPEQLQPVYAGPGAGPAGVQGGRRGGMPQLLSGAIAFQDDMDPVRAAIERGIERAGYYRSESTVTTSSAASWTASSPESGRARSSWPTSPTTIPAFATSPGLRGGQPPALHAVSTRSPKRCPFRRKASQHTHVGGRQARHAGGAAGGANRRRPRLGPHYALKRLTATAQGRLHLSRFGRRPGRRKLCSSAGCILNWRFNI